MLETKKIGNKIAEARKRINVSQAELAQRLFISSQAVGKWERGESMPDITTFNRLAEILGVDLNYFSENFQSSVIETSEGTFENQSSELSTAKQKRKWDMSKSNLVDCDFSGLKNLHEKFNSANMLRCQFIGSEMAGLLLKNNNIESCDFSGSDVNNSQIQGTNLLNNKFKDCSLKETEFSGSNIDGCDFSGSNLTGAEFSKSFIYGSDFNNVDFTGVKFKSGGLENNSVSNTVWDRTAFADAHLVNTIFEGTLEDCSFENCTFIKVKFQNATLINTFFKNNRKLKKVQFIDCKVDKITYAFLKSNLANLTGVTLLT